MKTNIAKKSGDIKAGDWVRFYQDGKLVIGVVQYTWDRTGGYPVVGTDIGALDKTEILEHRPATR